MNEKAYFLFIYVYGYYIYTSGRQKITHTNMYIMNEMIENVNFYQNILENATQIFDFLNIALLITTK